MSLADELVRWNDGSRHEPPFQESLREWAQCPICGGTGEVNGETCPACDGSTWAPEKVRRFCTYRWTTEDCVAEARANRTHQGCFWAVVIHLEAS